MIKRYWVRLYLTSGQTVEFTMTTKEGETLKEADYLEVVRAYVNGGVHTVVDVPEQWAVCIRKGVVNAMTMHFMGDEE